jgi:catechol 2,3-dioxygenase-like lactoylglutathione lyase family enzyme
MTAHRGFKVRALGEIAIRCDDLDAMANFYENIIGLDRLPGNASPDIVFFRIAEGFGGHTTVLALFDKRLASDGSAETPQTGARSALHHIALSLPYRRTGGRPALVRGAQASPTTSRISAGSAGAASSRRIPKATRSNSWPTIRSLLDP